MLKKILVIKCAQCGVKTPVKLVRDPKYKVCNNCMKTAADNKLTIILSDNTLKQKNRGTGAGGANTNYHGKRFEEQTFNQNTLMEDGYEKKYIAKSNTQYYLCKNDEEKTVVFVSQNGLKQYIKYKYGIELFRNPDEAYIIEYASGRKVIKVLEKKEQNVEGSVETKLWSGVALKREYEIVLGSEFEVCYGFCVSIFLKNKLTSTDKKYVILNQIFAEYNIEVLFGEDDDYFSRLTRWIYS